MHEIDDGLFVKHRSFLDHTLPKRRLSPNFYFLKRQTILHLMAGFVVFFTFQKNYFQTHLYKDTFQVARTHFVTYDYRWVWVKNFWPGLGLVNFLWLGLGRVSHLWFGFEFGKFPLNMSNFSIIFPSDKKNLFGSGQKVPGSKADQPLIYWGSKVSSGRVMAHLYLWP